MDYPQRILITGASGYIGRSISEALLCDGKEVVEVFRSPIDCSGVVADHNRPEKFSYHITDLRDVTDWTDALESVSTVIHLAAVVHAESGVSESELMETNVLATQKLAEDCARMGVKYFIFFSSVAVYGSEECMFNEQSTCKPNTPYGVAKLRAEQCLEDIGKRSQMEVLILRPPMVFGKDCPGNFKKLVRLLQRGLPLPLGSIDSMRSILSIDSIINFIRAAVSQQPVSGVFNIADNPPISFADLTQAISSGLNCPAQIFKFPKPILTGLLMLVGKASHLEKISTSICVDTSKIRQRFGWSNSVSVHDSVSTAASGFNSTREEE